MVGWHSFGTSRLLNHHTRQMAVFVADRYRAHQAGHSPPRFKRAAQFIP